MTLFLDVASWILIVTGSVFSVVGGIGLLRLPDLYTRLHGGGITDTMGACCVLGALLLQADQWNVVVKLLTILFFLLLTSPTSAHALSKAAMSHGIRPLVAGEEETSSST